VPIWFVNLHGQTASDQVRGGSFPEAIDLLSRALRAGHAFTTGLSMVADEMPEPVGTEFRLAYDRQNFGMPMPEAPQFIGRARAAARRTVLRDGSPDAA
jgi:tight adherence protein B